jgi:cobalt-zinc-cadmium efflux system outer membrane protein
MNARAILPLLLAPALALAEAPHAEPPYDADELLQLAEAHNPQIAAARAAIAAAEGRLRTAREYPNPRAEALADDLSGGDPDGDRGRYELRVVQPIAVGPRRSAAARMAIAEIEEARWRAELMRHDIYAQVRETELEVLYSRELTQLGTDLMGIAGEFLAIAEARGDTAGADRLRLEQELAVQVILGGATGFADALQRLRGFMPGVTLDAGALGDTLAYQPVTEELAVALDDAISTHPELLAAEAAARAADEAVRLARAERVPDINAIIGGGYDRGGEESFATIGVGIEIPVFSRQQGRIASALAELDAALSRRDAVRARLAADLVRERQTLSETDTLALDFAETLVPLAERSLAHAREAYAAGTITTTDALDALRAHSAAKRSGLRYLFEANRSRERVLHFLQAMPKPAIE